MSTTADLELLVTPSRTAATGQVTVCEPDPCTDTRTVAACASPDTSIVAVTGRSSTPASWEQAALTTARWSLD